MPKMCKKCKGLSCSNGSTIADYEKKFRLKWTGLTVFKLLVYSILRNHVYLRLSLKPLIQHTPSYSNPHLFEYFNYSKWLSIPVDPAKAKTSSVIRTSVVWIFSYSKWFSVPRGPDFTRLFEVIVENRDFRFKKQNFEMIKYAFFSKILIFVKIQL